jgi:hypothetical protein
MNVSDNEIKLIVAVTAAISAVTVAALSAALARIFAQHDRRRQMYGEAFRTALEWREMIYRVRRRDNTEEHDRALVDRFHELQERLDYFEGWIGSESKYMSRSYQKLVSTAKSATMSDLQAAWNKPGKKSNTDSDATHPVIDQAARDAYLRDVHGHLSLQPWRWLFVAFRNWREP